MSETLIKPKALRPGSTLAIISPAGATPDGQAFDQGAALLAAAGYRVKLMPHAKNRRMYLAGTDTERLADLHAAFADPEVDGILCARGGYGCMRLLPYLDFERVRQNPKVFIGFSDVTSLLLPFYQRTGLVGFYGPMLTSNLIHPEPFSQAELLKLVGQPVPTPYLIPNQDAYHSFAPGVAEGRLIGGNLSLLAALCGTPYQPETRGHILFIEDWKEKYYSLDRQFQQLKMAGLFERITGLLLCDFSEIEPEPELNLPDFLKELTGFLGVPVGYGFSVGHGEQTATLPIGCSARFDAGAGTLTLLEAPVVG
jgi:muramoyltetrapeptide carboxypeptidase